MEACTLRDKPKKLMFDSQSVKGFDGKVNKKNPTSGNVGMFGAFANAEKFMTASFSSRDLFLQGYQSKTLSEEDYFSYLYEHPELHVSAYVAGILNEDGFLRLWRCMPLLLVMSYRKRLITEKEYWTIYKKFPNISANVCYIHNPFSPHVPNIFAENHYEEFVEELKLRKKK
jgi:hypothetical protein